MSIASQQETVKSLPFPGTSNGQSAKVYDDATVGLFATRPGLQDKIEKAAQKNAEFEWLVKTLAYKLGIAKDKIIIAAPKAPGTIACKADRKFGGDIHQVLDDHRATVILEKPEQVDKVMEMLRKAKDNELVCIAGKVKVDKLKNTFGDSAYEGFETVKANFFLDDVPTEIQFRYPCNEKALKESHFHYERQRAVELGLQSFGERASVQSGKLSPEAQAEMLVALHRVGARAERKRNDANNRAFGNAPNRTHH